MSQALTQKRIAVVSVVAPIAISLFLTTGINIDPVNLPKMVLLAAVSGYLMGLLISTKFYNLLKNKVLGIIVLNFSLGLLITTALSGRPFWQSMHGSYGRNTGFLTYISLLILLTAFSSVVETKYFRLFLKGLFFSGLFNVFYGILQINNLDPVDWSNNFNAIIGTFGNPNFSSAFISISLITYPFLLQEYRSKNVRIVLLITFLISLYAIYRTNSQQGYFLFIAGFLTILIIFLFKNPKLRIYGIVTFLASVSGAVIAILGFLQKGPLATILYQPSISLRGFYWQAGMSMFEKKPLFGNGLDSYGNLYFRHRSADSILPPGGKNVFTNAAHNVYIDFAASGGILLLIPFLCLVIYTLVLSVKVFRNREFNLVFTTIFAAWICLQLQSLISINQIGIAVWVWAVNGALIGYALAILNSTNSVIKDDKFKGRKANTSASSYLLGSAFLAIFISLALPEQVKDMNFKFAMEKRNVQEVLKVVESQPLSSQRMFQSSQVFMQNSLYDEALRISLKSVEFDPEYLNTWIMLLSNPKASIEQRELAKLNLIRLDPRNTEWKKLEIK